MNPVDILIIEDSPTDALICREALLESRIPFAIHLVEDGEAAMAFLHGEGEYSDAPRPGLILLDLNLPRKNGIEVLREVKTDETLRSIPVVILSTSKAEEDVVNSYGLYANCYVMKPVGFSDFSSVIRSIEDFWFNIATLPLRKTRDSQ